MPSRVAVRAIVGEHTCLGEYIQVLSCRWPALACVSLRKLAPHAGPALIRRRSTVHRPLHLTLEVMSLHMLMVDTIEAQAMLSLQTSLRSVGSLLALHDQPRPDGQYGFCAVTQTVKAVTLQACFDALHLKC